MKSVLFLLSVSLLPAMAEKAPKIVFVLADDLGITVVNAFARHCTGCAADELFHETPHLDKLVVDGIAFSQSYANQLCSPTRAAILSGRVASTMGVTTATPMRKTWVIPTSRTRIRISIPKPPVSRFLF